MVKRVGQSSVIKLWSFATVDGKYPPRSTVAAGLAMTARRSAMRGAEGRPGVTRVEEAYRRILSVITEGALGEGDRLPSEAEMATTFGISRPMVRQALTRLQHAGVVDVRWGAGSYVRDVGGVDREGPSFGPVRSLNEVKLIYELRAALEGDAAALAAEHCSSPALAAMRHALSKLDAALTTDEIGQDPDMEFHLAIAAASQNPFFERMLRSIQQPFKFTISLSRSLSLAHSRERQRVVQAEHVAILQAIEARDPDAARGAMRTHLANACRRIFQGPGDSD